MGLGKAILGLGRAAVGFAHYSELGSRFVSEYRRTYELAGL